MGGWLRLCGLGLAVRVARQFNRVTAALKSVEGSLGELFVINKKMGVQVFKRVWDEAYDASITESVLVECAHEAVSKQLKHEEVVEKAKAVAQAAAGKGGQKGSGAQKAAAAGMPVGQQLFVQPGAQHLLVQPGARQMVGQQRQQRVPAPGDLCKCCGEVGHWARECYRNPQADARLVQQRRQREQQAVGAGLLALPAPGH